MQIADAGSVALASLLGGGGIWYLWRGVTILRRGRATWRWPVTEGTIVSAGLGTWTMMGEVGSADLVMYIPRIEYDYPMGDAPDGRSSLRGRTVMFGLDHLGYLAERGARAHLASYQPGQTVSVIYNPADRTMAVLERGQRGGYLWLFVGLMAALGALILILGAAFGTTG
ncbi:MAG: DUF3592 domain-containing protein [Xanthobacteraceae bacterium]|nr:DUF3592 domain-containing protein [Xanthobacteraceae bacterium]